MIIFLIREIFNNSANFGNFCLFKNKPEKLTIPFESITSFSDPSVNFSLQFEDSASQNLETLMDTKENDPKPQSDKDELESEEVSNIIQFEKYKK